MILIGPLGPYMKTEKLYGKRRSKRTNKVADSKYVRDNDVKCPICKEKLSVQIYIYPIKSSIFGAEFNARISRIQSQKSYDIYGRGLW
jgi:transcription elongation factor Elf1